MPETWGQGNNETIHIDGIAPPECRRKMVDGRVAGLQLRD
jgi:hypothetical protein